MFGLLYPLGSAVLWVGLHLAALFGHEKARKAVAGRRGWADRLAVAASTVALEKPGPWIHVHCASLGEYEQAAPLLEALRNATFLSLSADLDPYVELPAEEMKRLREMLSKMRGDKLEALSQLFQCGIYFTGVHIFTFY